MPVRKPRTVFELACWRVVGRGHDGDLVTHGVIGACSTLGDVARAVRAVVELGSLPSEFAAEQLGDVPFVCFIAEEVTLDPDMNTVRTVVFDRRGERHGETRVGDYDAPWSGLDVARRRFQPGGLVEFIEVVEGVRACYRVGVVLAAPPTPAAVAQRRSASLGDAVYCVGTVDRLKPSDEARWSRERVPEALLFARDRPVSQRVRRAFERSVRACRAD